MRSTDPADEAGSPTAVWASAFWSYVRRDDQSIHGKIAELRDDVCNFYWFQTGQNLRIFFDRDDIGWGQNWETTLSAEIEQAAFMIPIVTVNYFNSDYCRSELLDFRNLARARGVGEELILPIVFGGVELISTESDDEVARILARSQYEDFTDVWPYSRSSENWMIATRRIVERLMEAESRTVARLAARRALPLAATESGPATRAGEADAAGHGFADRASLPTAFRDATTLLGVTVVKLRALSKVIQNARTTLDEFASSSSGQPPRELPLVAETVRGPATEFEAAAAAALSSVANVDIGISALRQNLENYPDSDLSRQATDSLLESLGDLKAVREFERSIEPILLQIADLERLSAVLKRNLLPARRGFQFVRDAARLVLAWDKRGATGRTPLGMVVDG